MRTGTARDTRRLARGEDIPIGARIIAVVDCFDALTSDRPYRPRLDDRARAADTCRTQGDDVRPARGGRVFCLPRRGCGWRTRSRAGRLRADSHSRAVTVEEVPGASNVVELEAFFHLGQALNRARDGQAWTCSGPTFATLASGGAGALCLRSRPRRDRRGRRSRRDPVWHRGGTGNPLGERPQRLVAATGKA
jgi:hypothetical protein